MSTSSINELLYLLLLVLISITNFTTFYLIYSAYTYKLKSTLNNLFIHFPVYMNVIISIYYIYEDMPLGNKRNKKDYLWQFHRIWVVFHCVLSSSKPILLVCIINYSSCIPYGTCISSWNKVENDTNISSFTSFGAGCKDVLQ